MKYFLLKITLLVLIGYSPSALAEEIHTAIRSGNIAKVRELLEKNLELAIPPVSNGGWPVLLAVDGNHIDIVRLLLKRLPRDEVLKRLNTPGVLARTVVFEDSAMFNLLLSYGVNINAGGDNGDRVTTALHQAVKLGKLEIVRSLLTLGADPKVL